MVKRVLTGLYHPSGPRGHPYCRRGHPIYGVNLFVTRDNKRRCLTCWRNACARNRVTMRILRHSEYDWTDAEVETFLARCREIEDLPVHMREQAIANLPWPTCSPTHEANRRASWFNKPRRP